MKRIYKDIILSTEYKKCVDKFTGDHEPYKSDNKFGKQHYLDIKMSLFHCQNGLCAYTEEKLCDEELFDSSKWVDGKYIELSDNIYTRGDLEHFNPELKETKGWLWDNLLMIDSNVNREKRAKPINPILKPDSATYDENKYLSYNHKINQFYPNDLLTDKEKKDVKYMIETLGINNVVRRNDLIKELVEAHKYGLLEFEEEPKEYITAWKMTKQNLKKASQ